MSADMSVDQVCSWLLGLGLSKDYGDVMRENAIDGDVLLSLSDKDLKDEMGIAALGDRRKITTALEKLKSGSAPAAVVTANTTHLAAFSGQFGQSASSTANPFMFGGGLSSEMFGTSSMMNNAMNNASNLFSSPTGSGASSGGFGGPKVEIDLLGNGLSGMTSPSIVQAPAPQRLPFAPSPATLPQPPPPVPVAPTPTITTPTAVARAPRPPSPPEQVVQQIDEHGGVGSSWADITRKLAIAREDAPAVQQVIAPAEHKEKEKDNKPQPITDAWNPDPEKLKTKTCKRWEETGTCHFGNGCWYAHGPVDAKANGGDGIPTPSSTKASAAQKLEAATAANNTSYRTRLCHNFKSGNCARGDKCDFAHGEAQLQRAPTNELCIYHFSVGCHTPNCKRSHDEKYRSSVVQLADKTPSGQPDMPYALLTQYQTWVTPKGMWLIETRLREGERRNRSTGPHLGAITVLAGDDSPVRGFKVRLDKEKQKYQWDRE